jgi:hypothetical protein
MQYPIFAVETIPVFTLQFALLLRDGVANSGQLQGEVSVQSGTIVGQQKDSSGVFLFYKLKPGAQTLTVNSDKYTPYYRSTTVAVTIPMPSVTWPAFPDVTLADPTLPLSDPGQTAAYKTQRQAATLLPTVYYPFPAGATLIRGRVLHGGLPVLGATVQQAAGTDPAYQTEADGQFVLFLSNPPGLPQQVTVNATAPALPAGSANVTVIRGLTVSATINL